MPNKIPASTIREWFWWLLGRRSLYRVAGHSLYPILRDGQMVFIAHDKPLQSQDIIIFQHPFRHILTIKQVRHIHDNGTMTIRGTTIESEDAIGAIPPTAIIGKVMSYI